ncbi:hypothetical protein MJO29_004870 [Puccinia striiformis f. sp. tritici]|uniref:hypothetical protein n=1 Tax=Puccinia striiformis f. sp. tritici TaxID=168172 RepID=UPI0020087AD2|nr:hypothetical protein Pst134EA_009007 [Puccinia striiformis f. sp. tritici]KAH9468463.1 hypothetical protein Pst134EA_009007 [Puccinia striiformis f. sp. tritici]KAI7959802.1 hypothetical protein MJO29_004870 [Puccinia striiformis f. sp. tritici]KAI9609589.1 hypothetical protein H4Q26_007549 [Puccinia striiformis f. sp. tritici PST-130]
MAFAPNINSDAVVATITPTNTVTTAPLMPTSKPSLNPSLPSPIASPQVSYSPYALSNFQQINSVDGGQSFSFATLASTPLRSLTPTSKPTINPFEVEQAPNTHSSSRAIATTSIVLLFVFGIIFIAGYWASESRSSRWKGLRWARCPESQWNALGASRAEPKRYISMCQVSEGAEQTASLSIEVDQPGNFSASKSDKVKRNPLQSYLNYRRACATGSLEEIDEEGDSLEQTLSSRKTTKSGITPGLGPARYRLKTSKRGQGSSSSPIASSKGKIRATSQLFNRNQTYCIPHTGSPGREMRKSSRAHLTGGLDDIDTDVGWSEFGINQRRSEGNSNRSTGVSYLLTRLKESMNGRLNLSSVRSSESHSEPDPPRTTGKGSADWESEYDFEGSPGPEDASELRYLVLTSFNTTPTKHISRKRELSLADIPLPEVPALTWNALDPPKDSRLGYMNQMDPSGTSRRCCEEMTTPTRPRNSNWISSSQALSPSSLGWTSPETPTRKPEKSTPNLTENRSYLAPSRLTF